MAETSSKSVLVLHGPNLNLLGLREPNHYGNSTLADIDARLKERAKQANVALQSFQSNSEVELIQQLHTLANNKVDFIIINPAAFTHTSVALRDALSAVKVPSGAVIVSLVIEAPPNLLHAALSNCSEYVSRLVRCSSINNPLGVSVTGL